MPSIKSAMTPFPYSVDAGASVDAALAFMREHQIRHLPVTENGQLVGMISDRDIKLLLGPDFAYPKGTELLVREAMIREAYIVELDVGMDEVLEHMAEHQIGSAIITRKGKLAGVFTVTDACRAFADFLREQLRRAGGSTAA
jgi:acetoin utilization protein AcuB